MVYKSILVHVDDDAGVEARIHLAAQLAAEYHACLIGAAAAGLEPIASLHVRKTPVISVGISETGVLAPNPTSQKLFQSIARKLGVETTWCLTNKPGPTAMAELAALADLIVCGAPPALGDRDFPYADLIMQAGRPVLVTPPGQDHLRNGHAVVAWKNTRESRRALMDAIPLLMRCGAVTLLHVGEGRRDQPSLNEALAFLRHHGVEAAQRILRHEDGSAAEQIRRFAISSQADLIALGAFGHSRTREWIFGGVTAALLQNCPIPCLFSH
jgi:nucleotide-binding universal stress UspA family protein